MTKVQEYIRTRAKNDPEFIKQLNIERERLELAIKLTNLRKSAGLTQKDLAEIIGKPQSTISRIETGQMNPSIELVAEIASGLGKKFVPEFK